MSWEISFFTREQFKNHVYKTVLNYTKVLEPMTLEKFNSNLIDPIKLTFDSKVYGKDIESIIVDEIARQRDKTNTNTIGYFHQNLFKLIKGCMVPEHGFDVIYKRNDGRTVYVELKNKHNTMNSSSSQKTFMRMQNQLLKDPSCLCYLVEVIASKSQNTKWNVSLDSESTSDERIRRVSIDKFYEEITGDKTAFKKICDVLPETIEEIVKENNEFTLGKDIVLLQLYQKNPDILKSLYLLAFSTYEGFKI